LNYTITLYKNDEIEKARKQYYKFEAAFRNYTASNENTEVDNEVKVQADLMKRLLFQ
jgi:hypothetical protein